jgi:hypothetical protein
MRSSRFLQAFEFVIRSSIEQDATSDILHSRYLLGGDVGGTGSRGQCQAPDNFGQ